MQGCVNLAGVLESADDASTEYLDLVWRVASSDLEAIQLASRHSQHCVNICERPLHLSIADPDILVQCILRGGVCPFNWHNIFAGRWRYQSMRMRMRTLRQEALKTVSSGEKSRQMHHFTSHLVH
jgi:hypothetical protein